MGKKRSRLITVHVNKLSRVGHINRHCIYLANVPDGATYTHEVQPDEPIRRRMCPECSPVYLVPPLHILDPGLTAVLPTDVLLSTGAAGRS